MGRLSFWVLLGLTMFALSLQDVQVRADVGPTESECRPYIEKAIHELKTGETNEPEESGGDSQEQEASAEDTGGEVESGEQAAEGESAEQDTDEADNDDTAEDAVVETIEDTVEDADDDTEEQVDDDKESEKPESDGDDDDDEQKTEEDEGKSEETKENADDEADDTKSEENDTAEKVDDDGKSEEDKEDDQDDTTASEEKEDSSKSGEDEGTEEAQGKDDDDDDEDGASQEDGSKTALDEESGETQGDQPAESVEDKDDDEKDSDDKDNDDDDDDDDEKDVEGKSEEEPDTEEAEASKEETEAADDDKQDDDEDEEKSKEQAADEDDDDDDDDNKTEEDKDDEDGKDDKEEVKSRGKRSTVDDDDDDEPSKEKENESDDEESGEDVKTKGAKDEEDEDDSKENDTKEDDDDDEKDDDADGKDEKDDDDDDDEKSEEESRPEDDLLMEVDIPDNLRDRQHIDELLHLDDEFEEKEQAIDRQAEIILRDLKRIYENAVKPLETLYKYRDLSNRHFSDPEIFSKPLILFMGPWSGGKSTIINYLTDNEYTMHSLRSGAEPSPAYFNIVMHGNETEVLDGTQLAADWTFSGLQKFGQGLEDRLRGLKLPNKFLEKVNIVEIPGILEVRKQVSRLFPFNDACQWFIDRADIIFLVYDPAKLDVGPETEAILDQLKGREYQTRIILNKADTVKPDELLRVQGALIWNISPLMSSAQPPVMYTTSLWSHPYETTSPVRLLQAQERAFLRDIRGAIDKRIENKIASARRFAVRVRNHAKMVDCYLTTYYNHKTLFGNKKRISDQIIENPQNYHIYEGLSTLTNISRYDLPDPEVYRDFFRLNPLYEFKKLSETCTYFRGCPINKLDVAIAYDLPELVGKYKKMAENALASVDSDEKSKS